MKKKILFIGLGGAGQRHLRIIHNKFGDKFKYFSFRKKNNTKFLDKNFNHFENINLNDVYPLTNLSYNEINNIKFDFVFIANPTSFHYRFLSLFLSNKTKILVEKPLIFPYEKYSLIKNSHAKILVGYQRRYSLIFKELSKEIKKNFNKIKKIVVDVNSYVPIWHKYEDYKELYACKKNLGGGALLTECHEIDMVLNLFGLPSSIHCISSSDKRFNLNVDTRYKLIAKFNKFKVLLNVNMFNKNIKRNFSIFYNTGNYSIYNLNDNYDQFITKKWKNFLKIKKIYLRNR